MKKQSWSIKEYMEMQRSKTVTNESHLDTAAQLGKVDFFLKQTKEEVLKAPKKKQKKYVKVMYQAYLTTIALLSTTTATFAATSGTYHLDPEVNRGLMIIQLTCLAVAGGIATVCFMLSGILKMLGLQDKMKDWDKNIIKGLIQVMTAPMVILAITTLIKIFLHLMPGYRSF
jgi:hypothetical protein